MKSLRTDHPALIGVGHTLFLRSVKPPESVKRLLQPSSSNSKLSGGGTKGYVTKGKWKGKPMYSLTLQERRTCPSSCQQWKNCYGNNMPFANRIDHQSPLFIPTLTAEMSSLSAKHPAGFVVRLHVLGDFFSVAYVNFWKKALKLYPGLCIFGYTHRSADSPIGRAVTALNSSGAWIRWSDAGGPMSANTDTADKIAEGILCPEQSGKTAGCTTCGLCWSVTKPIRFSIH